MPLTPLLITAVRGKTILLEHPWWVWWIPENRIIFKKTIRNVRTCFLKTAWNFDILKCPETRTRRRYVVNGSVIIPGNVHLLVRSGNHAPRSPLDQPWCSPWEKACFCWAVFFRFMEAFKVFLSFRFLFSVIFFIMLYILIICKNAPLVDILKLSNSLDLNSSWFFLSLSSDISFITGYSKVFWM